MRPPKQTRSEVQLNQLSRQLQDEAVRTGVNLSGTQVENRPFEMVTEYSPSGDQPEAIAKLLDGIDKDYHDQLLLGVTGSGKTYTMAQVIAKSGRPAVIMAHNKTLVRPIIRRV